MTKVLLVADTPWVSSEVRASLALGDWELEETHDPATAAERSTDADAVLVDMQVSSMGGMAVIRSIRQSTAGRPRPRLVLLLDRSADSFLAGRAGADASVLKPINPAELRAALAPTAHTEEE